MKTVKRCFNYLLPYKLYFVLSFILNIFYALFTVVALYMLIPVLKILFNEKSEEVIVKQEFVGSFMKWGDILKNNVLYYMQSFNEQYGQEKVLLLVCISFVVMFLFRNVFSFLSQYFMTLMRYGIIKDLRIETHDKILTLPTSFYNEKRKGDIISRLSNDIGEISNGFFSSLMEIVKAPVSIIIIVFSLYMMSPEMTIYAMIIFPITGVVISVIGSSLKRNSTKAQGQLGMLFSSLDESVSGNAIIKIFNAEKRISKKFRDLTIKLNNILIKVSIRQNIASPTSETLGSIGIGFIVFFGGSLSLQGKGLGGAEFIAYIGLFYLLLDPIKKFAKSITEIQKSQVSAERVFEILDEDVVIFDKENAIEKSSLMNEIKFDNISFSYGQNKKEVVKNFTLTIPKGKSIALVGQSGSGKSTLAQLITRLYDTTKGKILIDGKDIKDIKLESYRGLFGMVTQQSILFNDTIYNNIAFGSNDFTEEQVINAAKIANAHDFILETENGYQTNIGDSGAKLSGGQKQRICIARAVISNPDIMVLDEATSALDTESEKSVQDALENVLKERTSLVIAHRLSTIQNSDLIVVMEKGKIVEQGTHLELINNSGHYKRYTELQNLERN